ncbi:MAG: hypothetical protein M1830_005530 [Pleopsidium flavum]|nr:MAG: hypothetical protein M1830_005530 [Pleopsidium flavum]
MSDIVSTKGSERTSRRVRRRQKHCKPHVNGLAGDNASREKYQDLYHNLDENTAETAKHTASRVNRFAALLSPETDSSNVTETSTRHTTTIPRSFTLPQSKFTFTSPSNVSYASAAAKPIPAVIKPTKPTTRVFRRSLGRASSAALSSTTQMPVTDHANSTLSETKLALLSLFTAGKLEPSATPAIGLCPTSNQSVSDRSTISPSRNAGTEDAGVLIPKAPIIIERPAQTRHDGTTASSTSGWPAPSGNRPAPSTPDRKSRFFPATPHIRPPTRRNSTITSTVFPEPSLLPTPELMVKSACQASLPRLHGRSMSTIGDDSETEWANARMMPSYDQIECSGRSLEDSKTAQQQDMSVVPGPAQGREEGSDLLGKGDDVDMVVEGVMATDEDAEEDEGYFTAGSSTEVGSDWEGRDEAYWA